MSVGVHVYVCVPCTCMPTHERVCVCVCVRAGMHMYLYVPTYMCVHTSGACLCPWVAVARCAAGTSGGKPGTRACVPGDTCVLGHGCGAPMGQSSHPRFCLFSTPAHSRGPGLHTCASVSIHVSVSCARVTGVCTHVSVSEHTHMYTHTDQRKRLQAHRAGPPAVEVANVLHISEDDCLLAGHGCGHMGAAVQVLHVVTP